jgi:prepilin-type processing-associated H-X9-DG protein
MYIQDYDEDMVPHFVNTPDDPLCTATNTAACTHTWVKNLDPYTKSYQIYHCPDSSDPAGVWGSGPAAWWGNWQNDSAIGYNYLELGEWWQCTSVRGVGLAAVDQPASTIAFTDSAFQKPTDLIPTNTEQGFYDVNAPAQYAAVVPAVNTCTWVDQLPLGPNGNGGFDWSAFPTSPTPDYTGWTINRHTSGINVSWVDGHAKFLHQNALWQGTNVAPGVSDQAVRLITPSAYLWGTLNATYGSVP